MILLDTHVLFWAVDNSKSLSRPAASPITPEIATLAGQFPRDHSGDPADRIIGGTARAEGLTLVTHDERIRKSPLLKTVW